jgi:hypothetical protein
MAAVAANVRRVSEPFSSCYLLILLMFLMPCAFQRFYYQHHFKNLDPEAIPRRLRGRSKVILSMFVHSSVIIIADDKTLKVTQTASLMTPPPLSGRDLATNTRKGKAKEEVKTKTQVRNDGEYSNDDEDDDDGEVHAPTYKDNHDLTAQLIVQRAS